MQFSLFYEMQLDGPTRDSEARLFHDCVQQAVLADRLGYRRIWAVEHHGLYEYSHSSAPEVFLAFVAARTRRIRLGHGVTLTPFRYNHPLRIAERIATLDILSDGRVDWGSGKSSSLVEQLAFENDVAELHAQWREALTMIPQMWQQEVFSYHGRFFQVPPTQVVPRPVQLPHPPVFAACSNPQSAEALGELGVGALNFAVGDGDHLARKVNGYRAAFAAGGSHGWARNEHFACAPVALCLEDDHEAARWGFRGAGFFADALTTYYAGSRRPLGPLPIRRGFLDDADLAERKAARCAAGQPVMNVIGDPVHCREIVGRYAAAGVDELILIMQTGPVPHELVLQSIRTFGEQVMPHFG